MNNSFISVGINTMKYWLRYVIKGWALFLIDDVFSGSIIMAGRKYALFRFISKFNKRNLLHMTAIFNNIIKYVYN